MYDHVHTTSVSPLCPLDSANDVHAHTRSHRTNICTGTTDDARTGGWQLNPWYRAKLKAQSVLVNGKESSNTMSLPDTNLSSLKMTCGFSATQTSNRWYVQRPDGVEDWESNPSVALLFVVIVGLCVGLDGHSQRVSIRFYFSYVRHAPSTRFLKTTHWKTPHWTRW